MTASFLSFKKALEQLPVSHLAPPPSAACALLLLCEQTTEGPRVPAQSRRLRVNLSTQAFLPLGFVHSLVVVSLMWPVESLHKSCFIGYPLQSSQGLHLRTVFTLCSIQK